LPSAQTAGSGSAAACAAAAQQADSLADSSSANGAEQLEDQAAQLRYLRECHSLAQDERQQLLALNRQLTALLVARAGAGAGAGGGVAAAAEGADGNAAPLSTAGSSVARG
jgi:hypothetical protein